MTITDYVAQTEYRQREHDLNVRNERHRRALERQKVRATARAPRARRILAILHV